MPPETAPARLPKPSKDRTASSPVASGAKRAPRPSRRTAEGVPVDLNARPTRKSSSRTISERRSIFRFTSCGPVDTTNSCGALLGGLRSQNLRSSSIRKQKPQEGFQNRSTKGCPRKSPSFVRLPETLGSINSGAGSPMFCAGPSSGVALLRSSPNIFSISTEPCPT
ncbi:hypothetical protein HDF09_002225 [Edaphobacter lichenicola]|uniref:Uncharacterized protein n=1 Tax=Tunturiibacter empetritectus TaxID=3069691 RepID=A0A7W8IJG7_9BACT|nr:hypothetical protein [Edaphobacter lichenicola]